MKKSSDGKAAKRSSAMNCLLVNQFATPGLGSLMGRRYVEGAVQLVLAIVGCGLFMAAFFKWISGLMGSFGQSSTVPSFPAYGKIGIIIFAASWLLAWITSMSLLRNAPTIPPEPVESKIPPKLDGR